MTKSIEQIATEYAGEPHDENENRKHLVSSINDLIVSAAKARDAQWSAVVSELRESIKQFYKAAQRIDKFGYGVNIESNQVITNTEDYLVEACATGIQALTKADQLLKEMVLND